MSADWTGPIHGSYWVRPGKLLAGPYPVAWKADITRQNFERLWSAGINYFVDLTEPDECEPYLGVLWDGAEYHRLSIPDFDTPHPDHLRDILDVIDAALLMARTVYVHCLGGIGRTGTVIGCYLVRHGMPGPEAVKTVTRWRGVTSPETEAQRQMIQNWREE